MEIIHEDETWSVNIFYHLTVHEHIEPAASIMYNMKRWCDEFLGYEPEYASGYWFFISKEDAVAFKLKWG